METVNRKDHMNNQLINQLKDSNLFSKAFELFDTSSLPNHGRMTAGANRAFQELSGGELPDPLDLQATEDYFEALAYDEIDC